jgi:hypothetical protein
VGRAAGLLFRVPDKWLALLCEIPASNHEKKEKEKKYSSRPPFPRLISKDINLEI